jgi:uncharacterized membrane protein YfcA
MAMDDDDDLGGKFWLLVIGGSVACVIVGILLFVLVAESWMRWGFLGMFLFISLILLAIGWFVDRRDKKRGYDFAE